MSSVQKLGVPILFFTVTAVHASLKSPGELGERENANSRNTS